VEVSQLNKMTKLDLKSKNGKRIAVLEFSAISNKRISESQEALVKPTTDFEGRRHVSPQNEPSSPKRKENAYVCVSNWREDKITLKSKQFGITSASKLLFELN
jgi:hypothetical protein